MTKSAIIKEKLEKSLNPVKLEITDDSAKHKGHAGWQEGGESHFSVFVVSDKFTGLNRVKRHKLIYDILDAEIKGGIHALAIKALAPEEIS